MNRFIKVIYAGISDFLEGKINPALRVFVDEKNHVTNIGENEKIPHITTEKPTNPTIGQPVFIGGKPAWYNGTKYIRADGTDAK